MADGLEDLDFRQEVLHRRLVQALLADALDGHDLPDVLLARKRRRDTTQTNVSNTSTFSPDGGNLREGLARSREVAMEMGRSGEGMSFPHQGPPSLLKRLLEATGH